MTLTKNDLEAIGTVVDEKLQGTERHLRTEIDKGFVDIRKEMREGFEKQHKSRERHFADLKILMETNYVSREEFEQVKEALQNEVDELRKEINQLKQSQPS
jgi:hypothetical protein